MPSFKYTAIDRDGKKIRHSMESASVDTAKSTLRQMGCTIIEIYELSAMNRAVELPFVGKPKAKSMAVFCRQFASLLRAGVSMSQILAMLGQQTENRKLAAAIHQMQADIEKGDNLTSAMGRHTGIFPELLVNMVAAGEESGRLEASFLQMEVYFDKAKRTGAAIGKAMTYPAILVAVMLIVLFVMMTKIIPSFLTTFEELDMELPAVTQLIISVSEFFTSRWWMLLLLAAGLIMGVCAFRRGDKGKHFFGWLSLRLPLVKSLSVRSACAVFSRSLSLLLTSGVGLPESLELTANNMRNIYFKEAVREIAGKVEKGWQLNAAIQETGLFPPMVYNLVSIGEETGDIQGMLDKTAEYYDEEVAAATQRLLSLMEPAMLLFLAVFVVIIVLSIFLPMLNMTGAYDSYL